jgi:anti-sigma factor RsiW
MSCQWQEKIGLYVDDELDPAAQQKFSAHLVSCLECLAAVSERVELKKAVRVAGRSFNAPPDLHAAIYKSLHPHKSVSPWWKWALAPLCALLLGIIGLQLFPNTRKPDPVVAGITDLHVITLASSNPVDVVSDDRHTVKPWFQGKLPFTFNLPELANSPFLLKGGKVAYIGQQPGAELLYTAGAHKISVFVLQARDAGRTLANRDLSFSVNGWAQGGLQYYLVTDANKDESGKLVSMFQEANRQ